jgi:hypothetical protein
MSNKSFNVIIILIFLCCALIIIISVLFAFDKPNLSFAIESCSNDNLRDNFSSIYNLDNGQTSPNGKWENVYSGHGSTGVEVADGSHVFYLKPATSTSSVETAAALVKSTDSFCNFNLDFDTKTVKQLRENSPPNTWETGWIFFRYTDTFHYYWFTISTAGIELGKKDCDSCKDPAEGQQFLVTKPDPKLDINSWSHWKINAIGNHIQVFVDGKLEIDYIDDKMSTRLSGGNIAMYSEDAYVRYDNIDLESK